MNQHPNAKFKLSESEWRAVKAEMRAIMIDCARKRETIAYSDVSLRLTTAYLHPHSFVFTRMLTEICREEREAGRGMLCALVVRKATGIPGPGYFTDIGLRCGMPDGDDPESLWRDELETVFDYWAAQPLDE